MTKSKETFEKVADFFQKRGDKEWAKAKNGEGGYHYNNAKQNYDSAQKAKDAAKGAPSKKSEVLSLQEFRDEVACISGKIK